MTEENNERISAATNEASQLSRPNDGDNVSACSRRYSLNSALETFMNSISRTRPLDGSDLNLRQVKMLCNHIYGFGQNFPISVTMKELCEDANIDDVNDLIRKGYLKQAGDSDFLIQELVVKALIDMLQKHNVDESVRHLQYPK